jgi:hypothetical protein
MPIHVTHQSYGRLELMAFNSRDDVLKSSKGEMRSNLDFDRSTTIGIGHPPFRSFCASNDQAVQRSFNLTIDALADSESNET